MEIQNFRYYLQDATNFFVVGDYVLVEEPYQNVKGITNWFSDPIKENRRDFYLTNESFTIRRVVDKKDGPSALFNVFDTVVRYYTFNEFVQGEKNIKLAATKAKKKCTLKIFVDGVYQEVVVEMFYTKTKAIIECVLFTPERFEFFKEHGIKHRDPEELERLGDDEEISQAELIGDVSVTADKAFMSRRFAFDEYLGEDEQGRTMSRMVVKTVEEILNEYYPFWHEQMTSIGKVDQISFENCVNDYCVVNWAWEVDNDGNKI